VRQHGKVEAQGEGRHLTGRVFLESLIQEIQSAGQECEQQRILPHFRRDEDDGRKECDEHKPDETGKAARGFA